MGYTLVYTQVLEFLPYLIKGAWISLQIAILAFFGGMWNLPFSPQNFC